MKTARSNGPFVSPEQHQHPPFIGLQCEMADEQKNTEDHEEKSKENCQHAFVIGSRNEHRNASDEENEVEEEHGPTGQGCDGSFTIGDLIGMIGKGSIHRLCR